VLEQARVIQVQIAVWSHNFERGLEPPIGGRRWTNQNIGPSDLSRKRLRHTRLYPILSNQGIREQAHGEKEKILVSPSLYKARMKEAKKIFYEL
jgi:hypothetical protein